MPITKSQARPAYAPPRCSPTRPPDWALDLRVGWTATQLEHGQPHRRHHHTPSPTAEKPTPRSISTRASPPRSLPRLDSRPPSSSSPRPLHLRLPPPPPPDLRRQAPPPSFSQHGTTRRHGRHLGCDVQRQDDPRQAPRAHHPLVAPPLPGRLCPAGRADPGRRRARLAGLGRRQGRHPVGQAARHAAADPRDGQGPRRALQPRRLQRAVPRAGAYLGRGAAGVEEEVRGAARAAGGRQADHCHRRGFPHARRPGKRASVRRAPLHARGLCRPQAATRGSAWLPHGSPGRRRGLPVEGPARVLGQVRLARLPARARTALPLARRRARRGRPERD